MSKDVVLVDYGVGNLLSVARAFEACGANVILTSDASKIAKAERIVLPGVGAIGDCLKELRRRELVEPILAFARSDRPMLGICVGMQVLLEIGEEFGEHPAFGLIRGRVKAIPNTTAKGERHKIPHIGWTAINPPPGRDWSKTVLEGIAPGSTCYFVHSFTAVTGDPTNLLAVSDYNGRQVTAAIQAGRVFGVQFHPEKSGKTGLQIVSRFLELK
jgi:imidazole glycerol-phosphate synthase subunit HisH